MRRLWRVWRVWEPRPPHFQNTQFLQLWRFRRFWRYGPNGLGQNGGVPQVSKTHTFYQFDGFDGFGGASPMVWRLWRYAQAVSAVWAALAVCRRLSQRTEGLGASLGDISILSKQTQRLLHQPQMQHRFGLSPTWMVVSQTFPIPQHKSYQTMFQYAGTNQYTLQRNLTSTM